MSETIVAISADRGIPKTQLDKLSRQTALPLAAPTISADYLLHITTDKLELRKAEPNNKKLSPRVKPNTDVYTAVAKDKILPKRLACIK